jgi:hypothetical protein
MWIIHFSTPSFNFMNYIHTFNEDIALQLDNIEMVIRWCNVCLYSNSYSLPGYKSRGPGSIPGATRFFLEVVGLERGPLSLVSTIEELLDRKSSGSESKEPILRSQEFRRADYKTPQ